MKRKLKGSISQIITATILTPLIVFLFLNLTVSTLHIFTRNNLNQIAQESVNDIVNVSVLTENLNKQYKKEIDKYKVVLKDYQIIYTFSEYDDASGEFIDKLTITDSVNTPISSTSFNNPTKVTVTINQLNRSTLQKVQNMLTGNQEDSKISVHKSALFKGMDDIKKEKEEVE